AALDDAVDVERGGRDVDVAARADRGRGAGAGRAGGVADRLGLRRAVVGGGLGGEGGGLGGAADVGQAGGGLDEVPAGADVDRGGVDAAVVGRRAVDDDAALGVGHRHAAEQVGQLADHLDVGG